MENLTLEEFERILISLLTEAEGLDDCAFTETINNNKNCLNIKDKNGTEVSVVLSGYYDSYKKEKNIHKSAEMALNHIIEELNRKKTEAKVFDLKNLLESVLLLKDSDGNLTNDNTVENNLAECDEPGREIENTSCTPELIQDILGAIKNIFDETVIQKQKLLEKVNGFFVNKKYSDIYSSYAYTEMLNMLFVYHVGNLDSEDDIINGCIPITKMEEIGVTIQEVHAHALENLVNNYPVSRFEAAGNGVILSNKLCKYGATSVLYPNVLDDMATENQSDLLIVPLSMDAFYVVPDKGPKDWLMGRIHELMKKKKDSIVSDKVIRYSFDNKNLFV